MNQFKVVRYDGRRDAYLISYGRSTKWIPAYVIKDIRARTKKRVKPEPVLVTLQSERVLHEVVAPDDV